MRRARRVRQAAAGRLRGGRARLLVGLLAAVALAAGVVVGVLAGGDSGNSSGQPDEAAAQRADRRAGDRVPSEVAALLRRMPVERKVAQLMLVGFEGTSADEPPIAAFEDRDYAGLVFEAHNYTSPGQISSLVDEIRETSEDAGHVTPWLMAPQEGGEFNVFDDLPPEDAPSEIANPREAAEAAKNTAEALSDLGITGILAPLLDVAPFGGGAVGERGYSDEAEHVVDYARATVEAYEEADLFAAAKHFPGLGGASQPPEQGPVTIGLTVGQLLDRDLLPFQEAIEAGVPAIVVGHGRYATDDFVQPASTSVSVVMGLLREDFGFDGVAIADDVTSPAVTATLPAPDAAVDAVRAGVDLVYVARDAEIQDATYRALLRAVRNETITEERLDEALRRNLSAKLAYGLIEREREGDRDSGGDEAGGDGRSPDGDGASASRGEEERGGRSPGRSGGGAGGESGSGGGREGADGGGESQSSEDPAAMLEQLLGARAPREPLTGAKGEASD